MTYGTVAGVQAITPTLGAFGGSTVPTSSQVTSWLEEGAATINRALATAGYSVPVASGAVVYAELTALNNLYAGAYALRARGIDTGTGEEESRDVVWLREFTQRLMELASSDLTALGVTAVTGRPRRRIRTLQARRIDGYSGRHEGSTTEPNYVSD
jgi:hypothetical protein